MKLFIKRSAPVLGLLGLGLAGCQPDIEAPSVSAGTANFARYISVGNSLTIGVTDGGLYREGQLNSYPNILAGQFRLAGGGDFVQPLYSEAQANGSGYLRLTGFTAAGLPVTAPVTTNLGVRGGTPQIPLYTKYLDPINNLGVDGIRMSSITIPDFGNFSSTSNAANFNANFERITPAGSSQTYLDRVKATVASINPTFFTEWLGSNDVLGYATAGGAASSITPTATFTTNTGLILDALIAGGAKGMVSTIPDVANIPFFTTVGPTFKATLTANNAAGLVALTGAAAGGVTSGNRKQIATIDIRDAAGNGRQLFTLTSSPFLGLFNRPTGAPWRYLLAQANQPKAALGPYLASFGIDTLQAFGTTAANPIPSAFILDDVEQGQVLTATTAFNTALTTAATNRGLAVFDANTFFRSVAVSGYATNAVNNTAGYLSGNLFGLDGVHPTPRGYAVIANEMLKVINAKYGSTFQGVNPNSFRGVVFPQ
ncbi:SGNH/GDSL hydrolase family protein [Hymenobacter sp. BT770]|uniref:SGNH/GDSL hydrolase family protein n=1 Tax=Hymenobacter sp. BT770 TaxID=2886942 RepID=UPI001D11D09E|nr:SGNH/GDSL hydrolase family protein [Hymenobacter sp. BT770]MCC3153387.1 SGNH/GDSL hydrolase family protein [Hymenobacter sp. BT770]MDO3415531.1 SGNH/GDSL hydrolase family protein [Hymenobacter sp. BT770]